ncbi:MAG TPA: tripartite tricarboxylate transporter substrate binding protein [Burkholderiales bacterium]|nr:tripartite tricarboxylate transporter substrate binding protein [Burkholderiales bacterium]
MTRKKSVPILLFLALCAFAGTAWTQAYPSRAVKVLIPFPPGGAPDLVGRTLANRLAERLGQPFVVENRTGAGGNIAADAVAQSAPDGYTLFATSDGPLVINPHVYDKVAFDTLRDFAPISIAASAGLVLMACTAVPVSSVSEVIALARSRKLSYASSGFGSSQHMVGEMLKASAGIDLTHVPYKGFAQAVIDALACNVDLIFGAISTGLPHIRAGKLKPLAVTIPRRHPGLPDTPTFAEAGYPDVAIEAYMGLLAPGGTPRPIIDKLHAEVIAILKEKDTAARLTGAGLDLVGNSPEEFSERLKADLEKFGKVAKSLAAKAE